MAESATVTFQVPRDELVRALWKRVVTRTSYIESIALYLLLAAIAFILGERLTAVGIALVLYSLARPFAMRISVARLVAANPVLTDEKTVEFDRERVTARGQDWSASYPWRHFKAWGEDARYFYLDVGASGFATVLPKAAFNEVQAQLLRACFAGMTPAARAAQTS